MQFTEIEVIQKDGKKMTGGVSTLEVAAKEMIVKNQKDEALAIDFVKPIRDEIKKLDDKRKEYVGPANNYVKKVNNVFNPYIKRLRDIAMAVNSKLSKYRYNLEARMNAQEKKVDKTKASASGTASVNYRTIKDFEVVDQSKIPLEYYMLDESKIKDDIRKGLTIPGVKMVEKKVPAYY